MTVDRETEAEIRRLFFAEHWKKGTIAAQLGVHDDVVERVLGPPGPQPAGSDAAPERARPVPRLRPRDARALPDARLDAHLRHARASAATPAASARCAASCSRIARRGPARCSCASRRCAGEQAQIDWAHVGQLRVPGGVRPLYCFVMVLASLARDVGRARARADDGEPAPLARARGAVLRRRHAPVALRQPEEHRRGARGRRDPLSVRAARARARTARRAARLPRAQAAPRRAASSGPSATSRPLLRGADDPLARAAATRSCCDFLETIAMRRPHPTQKAQRPSPTSSPRRRRACSRCPSADIPTELVTSVPADKTAFVSFDTNRYSVHHDAADRVLTLVATDAEVRLLDGKRVVATHARSWAKNQRHRGARASRRAPRAASAAHATARGATGSAPRSRASTSSCERWLEDGRNIGSMVARTLKLLDLYGATVLEGGGRGAARGTSTTPARWPSSASKRRTRPPSCAAARSQLGATSSTATSSPTTSEATMTTANDLAEAAPRARLPRLRARPSVRCSPTPPRASCRPRRSASSSARSSSASATRATSRAAPRSPPSAPSSPSTASTGTTRAPSTASSTSTSTTRSTSSSAARTSSCAARPASARRTLAQNLGLAALANAATPSASPRSPAALADLLRHESSPRSSAASAATPRPTC